MVIKVAILDKDYRIFVIKVVQVTECLPLSSRGNDPPRLASDNASLLIQKVCKSVRWGGGTESSLSYLPSIRKGVTEAVKLLPAEH